jgi:hypothetical protein
LKGFFKTFKRPSEDLYKALKRPLNAFERPLKNVSKTFKGEISSELTVIFYNGNFSNEDC